VQKRIEKNREEQSESKRGRTQEETKQKGKRAEIKLLRKNVL
jgi:hypothetical protein